ncbi:MAG: galactitol-1-phosphate 5-dehydrogenase [Candidatus Latescibacteria bacterium]|nr:galactitol-1-phosphate 5-dehydrogenase [Candidatus Latescibacterota bacterium]
MRALMYLGTRNMAIQAVPEPQAAPDEVVLKVSAASICGSDLHGFLGKSKKRVPPLIMGHEFTGDVVAIGPEVEGFAIGDRVTINPILTCGRCEECQRGRSSICPARKVIGIDRPGAFAEYVAVPAHLCFKLPDHVGDVEGSMIESLSNALHIFDRSLHGLIKSVAIVGAGTQGLLALQVARLIGATQVFITDLVPSRLRMAEQFGVTAAIDVRSADPVAAVMERTNGRGVDLSVEAVGHASTQRQAVSFLKQGGEAVFLGLGAESNVELDGLAIVNRELTIRGSYAYTNLDFARSLDLIGGGKIDVKSMVAPKALDRGVEMFETLVDRPGELIKVALVP